MDEVIYLILYIFGGILVMCFAGYLIVYFLFCRHFSDNTIDIIPHGHNTNVLPIPFKEEVTFIDCPTSIKISEANIGNNKEISKPVECAITKF